MTREIPALVGTLTDFSADPVHWMWRLYQECGPIAMLDDGEHRLVFVFRADYNQVVLSDGERFHSRLFPLRGSKRSALRRITSGLFSMNGDQYRERRRLMQESFQKRTIATYFESITTSIDEMTSNWQEGQTIDLNDALKRLMLRIAARTLFGFDDVQEAYRIGGQFQAFFDCSSTIVALALKQDEAFHEAYRTLQKLAEDLDESLRGVIAAQSQNVSSDHLLGQLMVFCRDGVFDENELVGHVATLFGAGNLTNAYTLLWTLFLLAQHPLSLAELHDEMATGCEVTSAVSADDRPVLSRAIKESMRLLPVTAFAQRVTTCPVTIGAYELPLGTSVIYSPFVTHRLEDVFPSASRFDPDRWRKTEPGPYAYIPFGGGARLCPGASLAGLIARLTVVKVLSRYQLQVLPQTIDALAISTDLQPMGPVQVRVCHAAGEVQTAELTGNINQLVSFPVSGGVVRET